MATMLKPVEKQRVAEEIVEQLRSLILTGQYKVGSKLPPERELAKKLGVNRASLREALKKLEHMGLVRIRQGDGTRVQNFMETAGIELVRHLVPLGGNITPAITRDVLEFRRIIGREVARLAAQRVDASDLAQLEEIAARAAATELNPGQRFQLDFDFYMILTAATKNRVLVLLINSVRDAVREHMALLSHLTMSSLALTQHHTELIGALRRHDADAAARAADDYLGQGVDHVMKLLQQGAALGS
ncbi:MAG TPA: FadR/GntR family transcriptional regulator [Kofleriaceae bacterium]|jgi:DNA-binding FadR family transcriptional regulator|nr:FadR/GntR family transcriptional regulator [Kofleriaceae bacterium]